MPSQKSTYQMSTTYGYKRETRMVYQKAFESYERMRDWFHLNDMIDERAAGQIPCRQAPDVYFPDQREGQAAMLAKIAKEACRSCEVINECAAYALKHKETDGIWGGMTPNDRREIWSKR
jgi:hypothetical protein